LAPEKARAAAERMAVANRGRKLPEEHKTKIAAKMKGRRLSAATKRKLSETARRPAERLRRSLQACANNLSMARSGTLPERIVGAFLVGKGVEYQSQFALPGSPFRFDFAIPAKRILIEVDGCYWHGCARCGHAGKPDTIRQDRVKTALARRSGWRLLRIRACKLERLL
jgi:DNA mismatch endonuclease (patch repair protein)